MSNLKISTGIVQKTISIDDGRKFFWQWDTGCQISVSGISIGSELHFHRLGLTEPFTLKVYQRGNERVCNVPDEILQEAGEFVAYVYIHEDDGCHTIVEKKFIVKPRPQPTNYIYTETERYTVEKVVEDALLEAKESGEFDGKDGVDGKDGHTPEKGVDYYTEEDKTEMVNAVLAAMPDGDGVSY